MSRNQDYDGPRWSHPWPVSTQPQSEGRNGFLDIRTSEFLLQPSSSGSTLASNWYNETSSETRNATDQSGEGRTSPNLPQDTSNDLTPLETGGHGQSISNEHLTKPLASPPPNGGPRIAMKSTARFKELRTTLGHWKWEIINCILLHVALFAILATLYLHDGERIPQWPFSITINALLSIYAVWFKASVLFVTAAGIGQLKWAWFSSTKPIHDIVRHDEAGSGPWGSFKLLSSMGFRQPLAAFGAAIMIIAIAVDPFTQQLISPVDCSLSVNSDGARIPVTSRFDGNPDILEGSIQALSFELRAAVLSGLYTEDHNPDFHCSTGNCTFETPYTTLGFCSACSNITDELATEKSCFDSMENRTTTGANCTVPNRTGYTQWNTYVPPMTGSLPVFSVTYRELWGDRPGNREVFTAGTEITSFDHNGTNIETGQDLVVILASTGRPQWNPYTAKNFTGCDTAESVNSWACRGYGAAKCSIQPCVQVHGSTTIRAGRLHEEIIDHSAASQRWGVSKAEVKQYDNYFSSEVWLGLVDTQCITPDERDGLEGEGYDVTPTDRWLPYDAQFSILNITVLPENAPYPQSMLQHKCLHLISQRFLVETWEYLLNPLFNGTVRILSKTGGPWGLGSTDDTPGSKFDSIDGPPELISIYNGSMVSFEQMEYTAQQLAASLTQYVRSNGHPNFSQPATGVTEHYAVCLLVNWPWFALPATLAVLTVVFFVLMVVHISKQGLPVWKSSPLALLFHGPGGTDWVDAKNHDLRDVEGMERTAEKNYMALKKKDAPDSHVGHELQSTSAAVKRTGLWRSADVSQFRRRR